jgi:myosin heavy subunit
MDNTTTASNGEMPNDAKQPQQAEMVTTATDETSGNAKQPTLEEALKELEATRSALKKANQEAASHRHKAKELDDLKAQIENEKLTEQQKLEKRLADIQAEHSNVTRQSQERIINYEVRLQAAQMGIIDTDAAARLLDLSEMTFDDAGLPNNVDKLLKDLVKNKPYLVGKTNGTGLSSGGATNPARSATNGPKKIETWADITAMSPDEYNARHAEIKEWMNKNPVRFGVRMR